MSSQQARLTSGLRMSLPKVMTLSDQVSAADLKALTTL